MSECAAETPITTTLTITRTEDEPLVIGPDCVLDEESGGGLYFQRLIRPFFVLRYDTTGPSPWAKGDGVLLNAQENRSDVTGVLVAFGTDRDGLETWRNLLTAALYQPTYQVSITVGDVTEGPWYAWPTTPQLADPISPRRAGLLAEAITVSIPVLPLGAP